MKIKNISAFDVRIPRVGAVASGEVIDCPSEIAKLLLKSPSFEKAESSKKTSTSKGGN